MSASRSTSSRSRWCCASTTCTRCSERPPRTSSSGSSSTFQQASGSSRPRAAAPTSTCRGCSSPAACSSSTPTTCGSAPGRSRSCSATCTASPCLLAISPCSARRTEGWAAGLQLFHLACRGRSPRERRRLLASLGTHFALASEYLARNVLADLEPELSDFLLETCVLGAARPDALCDELLGTTGSQARLAALAERQVFTRAIDERGATYRYHEVLRRHLELELVERIGEVSRPRTLPARRRAAREPGGARRCDPRAVPCGGLGVGRTPRGPRGRAPARDRRRLARPAAGIASPGRSVAVARRRAPRALGRPARRSRHRLQRGGGRVRHAVRRRPRPPRAAGARAIPRSARARAGPTSRAPCGRRRCAIPPPPQRGQGCSTAPSATVPRAWACCWPVGCARPPRDSRTRVARRTCRRCSRRSRRPGSRPHCCSPAAPRRASLPQATPPSSRIASVRRGSPGSRAPSGRSATPDCAARPPPRWQRPEREGDRWGCALAGLALGHALAYGANDEAIPMLEESVAAFHGLGANVLEAWAHGLLALALVAHERSRGTRGRARGRAHGALRRERARRSPTPTSRSRPSSRRAAPSTSRSPPTRPTSAGSCCPAPRRGRSDRASRSAASARSC